MKRTVAAVAVLFVGALAIACQPIPRTKGTIELDLHGVNPRVCDVLDLRQCLLPFPNDFFTVRDANTDTGRRVAITAAAMPRNNLGVPIDPTEWNRNDGFSPGSEILAFVPDLDLTKTGAPAITDPGRSLLRGSPVVLLDATTGERHPVFAELDLNAGVPDERSLIARPSTNLAEGHRYIVALQGLRDSQGEPIEATPAFRAFRDKLDTGIPTIEARRAHMEDLFESLKRAKVKRTNLYLAWDFTVASERNLSERLLHIRDDAFRTLGDSAPSFAVTEIEENLDDRILRRVRGTFLVPSYLTGTGAPGSRFTQGPDGLPVHAGYDITANFTCIVPRSAVSPAGAANPTRPSLYGHGLLGSANEVSAGNVRNMANEHNFVFCATNWIGMASEDVANAVSILQDLGRFPTLADRVQQGILDALFLGRLMIRPDGLVSHPAFQAPDGAPLIDTRALFYDGNSQGGIIGGALTAVAQDFTRAVLGVPGMNYSTLLQRSSDFALYALILEPAYPSALDQQIGIALIQMLWDRAEANGYAQHMTDDPYPNTPRHQVLLHEAFGDFQVANVTTEIEARTIGAAIHQPALGPGRLGYDAFFGLEPLKPGHRGSALIVWDSGTPPPPLGNEAPFVGVDPHEDPRANVGARLQKSEFLRVDGTVIDVCGGAPCVADPA